MSCWRPEVSNLQGGAAEQGGKSQVMRRGSERAGMKNFTNKYLLDTLLVRKLRVIKVWKRQLRGVKMRGTKIKNRCPTAFLSFQVAASHGATCRVSH